jgi:HAMP domain-containing protein
LQAEATEDLDQIPEAVAIIYEAEILELSSTNGAVAAVASTNNMTFAEAQELEEQFKSLEGQGLRFGPITFRGELLIGSIAEIKEENNQSSPEPSANETENAIGEVHVLFSQSEIFNRVIQAIIPLLVALGIIFIFALFLANALATRLARPIISATDQANRIALGDLDRTVVVETNDEIGDMLGSLERMRVSLKSMVARMRRNT